MKTRSDDKPVKRPMDKSIAKLMGLGERSVQKSYYPQLQKKIKELETSEARYRLLAENISDVIWMLDLDFSIVYISPSIQKMSGFGPEELTGRSFTQLLEPDHARRFTQEITQELEHPNGTKEGVREMELCQLNKAGTSTWIEIRVSLVSSEDGPNKKILGISRDITERKEAEKEKKQMESQLFQAQKMESIGTLAGGVAHDFNNLLTVINGYAELIQAKLEEDHPLTPKVQAISHAGQRAENLTRQLLAFSRKQIFKPEIISLNQTIKSMDQMLRRLIGEDIHVQTIASKGIGPISADQNQIEQVFTNLIVNARDALSGPGSDKIKKRITIETGETLLNLKEAQKRGLDQEGKYIFFSVSDNGQGMDLETQKRIFEPFFTTKSKYQGTGLGMAMIYGIVKQNKGSIRVYSEPNQGSVFKIYWPASSPKKPFRPEIVPPKIEKSLAGDESILLVEDDPSVLNFASTALTPLGYEVHLAENGKIALAWIESRIEQKRPLPDLVVTDLIMPELGGKAFIQQAKTYVPGIKVIFVSGHTDHHIVHNGMLDPGVTFLQKPYSPNLLAEKIREVLSTSGPG